MGPYKRRVIETADFLSSLATKIPAIGICAGTGLGGIVQSMQVTSSIEYTDLPHFPVSTVSGHAGKLLLGRLRGVEVMALQGRFHLYEGYTPPEVVFPIRVMQQLGVKHLILTNAAGGLNPKFQPGDVMIIRDHINLTGENPLAGPNDEAWGDRFPDMSRAYDGQFASLAQSVAQRLHIPVQTGIYAGLKGPSLETPAEVRYLRTIGADAVGFSTVQEAIAAVHARMRVLGLSTITNVHDPDRPVPAGLEEILEIAANAASTVERLLESIVENLNAADPG